MKRCMGLIMTAALVLSACGNEKTNIKEESPTTTVVEMETSKQAEETTSAGELETTAAVEIPAQELIPQTPLVVGLTAEYEGEWNDKGPIITADSSKIVILNDGYENLKETIDEYNERNWQEVQAIYTEHLEYVKDGVYPEGMEISVSREIEITRADSRVLSFINGETAFLGGAHGSYYENGEVYDAETGEKLELTDVVTDLDAVYKYVRGSLRENYEKESFFEGYEEWLEEMFYDSAGAMSASLEWVMTGEGLEFRFSPYALGPWVSGVFEVELPYEGNEELFVEAYQFDVDHPIRKIAQEEEIVADMNGDEIEDRASFSVEWSEETYSTTLTINRVCERDDGSKQESAITVNDIYGTFTDAYLMYADNDMLYLYLEFLMDNDWRKLEIVCLSNGEGVNGPVLLEGIGASVYGHFISDPERFALYDRLDILGTYMAYKQYSIGENGAPVPEDELYTFANLHFDWEHALTAKREIPVLMHVEGSDEKIETELPKGTRFRPRKTDGTSVVEMELEDGRRCDIPVERPEGEYVYYIDGVSEYDCFGDVPYAG